MGGWVPTPEQCCAPHAVSDCSFYCALPLGHAGMHCAVLAGGWPVDSSTTVLWDPVSEDSDYREMVLKDLRHINDHYPDTSPQWKADPK